MSRYEPADPTLRDRSLLSLAAEEDGAAKAAAPRETAQSRLARALEEARKGVKPRAPTTLLAVERPEPTRKPEPQPAPAAAPISRPAGDTLKSPSKAPAKPALEAEAAPAMEIPRATAERPASAAGDAGFLTGILSRARGRAPENEPARQPDEADAASPPSRAQVARSEVRDALELEEDTRQDDGRWRPLIDPTFVIRGVRQSGRVIAMSTVIGALIGVLIAMNTPKRFYAAAELLADPRDLNIVERELTQPGNGSEAILALVENQVRIITSGSVLDEVVNRLKLDDDPEFNGFGTSGLSQLISDIRAIFQPSRPGGGEEQRRRALAVTKLAEKITVARGGRTFVIAVGAETQDPEKSALVANTITQVFLDTYGRMRSDAAGRAAGELTSKLDELRMAVETAERKVETFKSQNDIIDAQGRLITDDEIVKLNEQLGVARARTLELSARAASLRGVDAESVIGGAAPEALSSASVQELRAQYSTLKGEADRLAARLGPRHPQLIAIQAQLAGARDLLQAEIARTVSSAQTELRRAVQLEQELSSRLAQLKVRQGELSNQLVTLRELERDSNAKRAVYEAFLLRAKETGEQQGINNANISIISQARPPLEAEPPSRTMIAMLSTALGALAGIGIGALRGTAESLGRTMGGRRRRTRSPRALGGSGNMFADKDDEDEGFDSDPEEETQMGMLDDNNGRPAMADGASQAAPAPFGPAPAHPYYGYSYGQPPAFSGERVAREHVVAADDPDAVVEKQRAALEDIRAGLLECKEAIRDMAEKRRRTSRYF